MKRIFIITGLNSYPIINNLIKGIHRYEIEIYKAPITISAFLSEDLTRDILKKISIGNYDLVLLPGFVQWDTSTLEKEFSIEIKKGPEFASDLPFILNNLDSIKLSNTIAVNKLIELSGLMEYNDFVAEKVKLAKKNISTHTFYINKQKSEVIIGKNLPPPIIAEIVNCPEKTNDSILRKVKHYIESGADIIDIGCIANKSYAERIREVIKLIRSNFKTLISIDSMEKEELISAIDEGIDMILSFDKGNYKDFTNIPKDIPIVILPTNIRAAYFPKEPKVRVENLIGLTKELRSLGFQKLIADPLLETPINPGFANSLETYFLYKKTINQIKDNNIELPLFFGISNVVELMDIDSVGINGLLASIAIELDVGVLFTVEHSSKLMGGVRELKDSVKLNYLAKCKRAPPINHGISIFKAKGKISQNMPQIDIKRAIYADHENPDYVSDKNGFFRFYVDQYSKQIYVFFYSNKNDLLNLIIGKNAETISKKIMELQITDDYYHLNYLGRELVKAEYCIYTGKPYIQDEKLFKKN
ncbi:MAG: dihydropteroate synthase-like protein [Candidatus Thorarchaeota archaeon]